MNIDKYKIIKKIKSGGQGTVFLVKYKNKKYALKIEKIFEKDIKKNFDSNYWREIEFATNMNKKYPNIFIKLYDTDIIKNYNYNLDNPYNIDYINKLNKSLYCSRKIYEYINYTLDKIINKLKLCELYSILIQLSYAIYIMNKNGYVHCDLHIYNIGIKITNKKFIYLFNKKIPTYGRIVKIIDYSSILHKKYKLNQINNLIGINEKKLFEDLKLIEIRRILDIIYDLPFYETLSINFWNKFDYKKDFNNFLNSDDLILVDNLVKNDLDKYTLFSILYPKKFQKRYLKSKYINVINNIIRLPVQDIIFLLNATHIKTYKDIKNIILYLITKLDNI